MAAKIAWNLRKTFKKTVACLLAAAIIWSSLPWSSFAAVTHGVSSRASADNPHFTASPSTQWQPEQWNQFAGAVNSILNTVSLDAASAAGSGNPSDSLTATAVATHLTIMMSDRNPNRLQASAAAFILGRIKNPVEFHHDMQRL